MKEYLCWCEDLYPETTFILLGTDASICKMMIQRMANEIAYWRIALSACKAVRWDAKQGNRRWDVSEHIATCATEGGRGTEYIYSVEMADKLLHRKRFRWRNDACHMAWIEWRCRANQAKEARSE